MFFNEILKVDKEKGKYFNFYYSLVKIREILLQLIHALIAACKTFGFRHNNIDANNIMIKTLKEPKNFTFSFGKKMFVIKNLRFLVKITDFSEATINKPFEHEKNTSITKIGLLKSFNPQNSKISLSRVSIWPL